MIPDAKLSTIQVRSCPEWINKFGFLTRAGLGTNMTDTEVINYMDKLYCAPKVTLWRPFQQIKSIYERVRFMQKARPCRVMLKKNATG